MNVDLKQWGFADVGTVSFPADGETVFADRRMPYAWTATRGGLSLVTSDTGERVLILDFAKNPRHLVRGSTAADGERVRILSEAEFLCGTDATSALVVLETETAPRGAVLKAILDRGGRGFVTDFCEDPFAAPDAVPSVGGCTENGNTSADAETRPFLGFVLSPRRMRSLRAFAAAGGLVGCATSDAQRFAGTTEVVTGVWPGATDVPGEDWVLCVGAGMEVAKIVARHGQDACTPVRVVVAEHEAALLAWFSTQRVPVLPRRACCVGGKIGWLFPNGHPLRVPTLALADLKGWLNGFSLRSTGSNDFQVHFSGSVPGFLKETAVSKWREYARGIVLARGETTLPQDFLRMPRTERPTLQKPLAESPAGDVIAALDGVKNLATALEEVERAHGRRFDESSVKRTVLLACRLAECGYLRGTVAGKIGREDIVSALRAVGVAEGDVLLVHSALSSFGFTPGGATTFLTALREAVGDGGTVLMPAFACSFRIMGVTNKKWEFRPFDPADAEQSAWVGRLNVTFRRTHPEAPTSGHATNAWTGFGPKAAELLAGHPYDDGPASPRSPLAKALAAGGKVVFLGADVNVCSFLHLLEDEFDLPGVAPALVSVRGPDGRPRDVPIARHLPGERAFYAQGEECRFFRAAKAAGLEIRRAPLGLGVVKAIGLEPLHRTGAALLKDDRTLLGACEKHSVRER